MANIRVDVDGVKEVVGRLTMFRKQVMDMSDVYDFIGERLANDARMFAPFLTGRLAASIRHDADGNSVSVFSRLVYAPIAHEGRYTHRRKGPRPFITQSMNKNRAWIEDEVEDELEAIIRRLGLNA